MLGQADGQCEFVSPSLLEIRRFGEYLWVYRSEAVRDASELFRPVCRLVGDAEPLIREWVDDQRMMFGRAEGLIYEFFKLRPRENRGHSFTSEIDAEADNRGNP